MKTLFSLFDKAVDLMNMAIYVIIALAVFGFMWGVVKILFSADNEVVKKEGRAFMLYGILTLFVMTSIWGLVNLLNGTIQLEEDTYRGDIDTGSTEDKIDDPASNTNPIDDIKDIIDPSDPEQRVV